MTQQLYVVDVGVEIDGTDGTITQVLNGLANPSVSPGVEATISSSYTRSVPNGDGTYTITVYDKFGPLDTDWLARVSSANTSTLDTIGVPDDSTYSDGIFSWTPSTKIANAVDDVNEFLALMAPAAAPVLSNITASSAGATGKLSFDSTHTITGYAYDATLINATVQNSGNNLGIFNGSAAVSGVLNNTVTAQSAGSYPAKAFGKAKEGVLELWVNGVLRHTSAALDTFASGTTGSGTYFTLSAAAPCQFSNGNPFTPLQYRIGTFTVSAAQQRYGYNYVEVKHVIEGSTFTTNQFYWYNSMDLTAITANGLTAVANMGGIRYLSGVTYYSSGSVVLSGTINAAYADVYSSSASAVSYSSSQCSYTPNALPLTTTNTASYTLDATGNLLSSIRLLNASASAVVSVQHPVKASYTSPAINTASILYDPITPNTLLLEEFNSESWRVPSVPANAYTSPTNYDSTVNVVAEGGLQYCNGHLQYPTGDYRSVSEGGTITYAPAGNPNYTGATGNKTLIRAFQNNTGLTKANFRLLISGGMTTFAAVGALTGDNLSLEMKFPDGSLNAGTGWLDAYTDYATGAWVDGNGCRAGSYGNGRALAVNWGITVGTKSIAANEWV